MKFLYSSPYRFLIQSINFTVRDLFTNRRFFPMACRRHIREPTSQCPRKRGANLFFEKFASSRQSPRPRWSASCNEEFQECSLVVGCTCWMNCSTKVLQYNMCAGKIVSPQDSDLMKVTTEIRKNNEQKEKGETARETDLVVDLTDSKFT